VGVVFFS